MTTHQDDGGPGHGPSLDAALDAAAAEQVAVNQAAGRRTMALGRALAVARSEPTAMLDVAVARVASTTAQRRAQVAHRALVSEVACALGVSEHRARGLLADASGAGEPSTGPPDPRRGPAPGRHGLGIDPPF